jgi:membrane associated rhomboid family serine protease
MKVIIGINVALFLLQGIVPGLTLALGLSPVSVVAGWQGWRLVSYMFLHGSLFHILFNMLGVWLFGTELEARWGSRSFVRFYLLTGVGAGIITVLFSFLPFGFARHLYVSLVIGASGAVYGLLLAFALYNPDRPIFLYFLFPIPAKYFVMIMGAIAFYSSLSEAGGVANATHLGGLVVAYALLRRIRLSPWAEVKYRYAKWRIARARKRFDVYSGGRSDDDWTKRVH